MKFVNIFQKTRGQKMGVVRIAKDPIWSILSVGEGAKPSQGDAT